MESIHVYLYPLRMRRYQCCACIIGMRRNGACGGGLVCLRRDEGVLKNLDVFNGDVLDMEKKYDGRTCRRVLYGEHKCISFSTEEMMASLSHWSVVYMGTGFNLFSSAGVIACSGGSGCM